MCAVKAVILAAGFGTRLKSLGIDLPKPLLEVRGRPLIDYLVDHLVGLEDLSGIVVITNGIFESVFKEWQARSKHAPRILVLSDGCTSVDQRLGSVGDQAFAIRTERIEEDLLVVGGDNLFDLDLREFASFAKGKDGPSTVCYEVQSPQLASMYSTIVLERDRITYFREKDPDPRSLLVGICVYFYPRTFLPMIQRFIDEGNNPDASGNLLQWLVERCPLYGKVLSGRWMDIGSPEEYRRAQDQEWVGSDGKSPEEEVGS